MSSTNTTTASADRDTGRTHRDRARKNTMLWAVQFLLAAVFVFAAAPKLAGAHLAAAMFGQIGVGQWLRYLVGTAELAGAVGLLIPGPAGSPLPGSRPTWPARPSSTSLSCTVPPSR
jgi:hypothetical protein